MFEIGSDRWPGISKLIEECGEVLQVCGKLIAAKGEIMHWDMANRTTAPNSTDDLKTRLTNEIADLQAALTFVTARCDLDVNAINARMARKLARFEGWHEERR